MSKVFHFLSPRNGGFHRKKDSESEEGPRAGEMSPTCRLLGGTESTLDQGEPWRPPAPLQNREQAPTNGCCPLAMPTSEGQWSPQATDTPSSRHTGVGPLRPGARRLPPAPNGTRSCSFPAARLTCLLRGPSPSPSSLVPSTDWSLSFCQDSVGPRPGPCFSPQLL